MHEFGSGKKVLEIAAIAAASAWCALTLSTNAVAGEGKAGIILYVDDDAPRGPNGGDGLSWKSPLRYLQDALAIAQKSNSGVTEIRLGQGVYKPDQGANQSPGNVNATFSIPSGLALRGGYAGFGAPDPDECDWTKFESILSGDLLGDDGPPGSFQNYSDNCYQVVTLFNPVPGTIIWGVVVTASGIDIWDTSLGGGLRASGGAPMITNCAFRYNASYGGGAIALLGSSALVADCTFELNRAAGVGGGAILSSNSSPHIVNCEFVGNQALMGACGGAVRLSGGQPRFTSCIFESNAAGTDGGAAETINSDVSWHDCTFMFNSSACTGGAVNGERLANLAGTFRNCDFIGNYASVRGGGVKGVGSFIQCRFVDNFSSFEGGAGLAGGGTIINCEFRRNSNGGPPGGGAGAWIRDADSEFVNCVFNANDSWGPGGAAYVNPDRSASFTNCTFTNNITIGDVGGGISGQATVVNCVLWNNSPAELNGEFDVRYSCVAGGWLGMGNIDRDPILVDALGPDGVAGTEDDDLRLSRGSPCIDSGDNTALPVDVHDLNSDGNLMELLPIDLAGNLRRINDPRTPNTGNPGIYHVVVDLGAYEFADITPVFADLTGDGFVGVGDLLAVINSWGACPTPPQDCPADLDASGAVDMQDLLLVLANWM